MAVSILTTAQDGTGRFWLSQYGYVTGWRHTSTFPGGPASASFDFVAPSNFQHPAVMPGRFLYAYSGSALIWAGRLEQPARGVPWKMTATGLAALAKDYPANATNVDVLNTTIDQAISVGLPWTRLTSLLNPVGSQVQYSDTVDGILGNLVTQGQYWSLTPQGVVSTQSTPNTTPGLIVYAVDVPGGRNFDNYANYMAITYLNSGASGAQAYVEVAGSSADVARYGRHYKRLDLTGMGQISTAAATNAGQQVLARYASGPSWTNAFAVAAGQVFTLGGARPDIATIQPNVLVRVIAVNPDTYGSGQSLTDVPIGQVDYDDTTLTTQLTPLVSARTDLPAFLTKAKIR